MLNDATKHIKHDKHLTVDNDQFSHIKNNQHLTVEGESRQKIALDHSLEVGGSLHQKIGEKTVFDSGNEVHLKAGNKLVLDAGNEITIKAAGSFIKVDGGGVHLVGPAINLNSGGSAGSGSGYGGVVAALPMGLAAPSAPDEILLAPISASMTSLLPALATLDLPITELCQKKADGSCPKPNCECV
ncbi:Type VI secretion system tip protein VgrG [Vibrio ordalii]